MLDKMRRSLENKAKTTICPYDSLNGECEHYCPATGPHQEYCQVYGLFSQGALRRCRKRSPKSSQALWRLTNRVANSGFN